MTTPNAPQHGGQHRFPQQPGQGQPYPGAYYAQQPPLAQPGQQPPYWGPPPQYPQPAAQPPQPPRKKGGKTKWVVGAIALLIFIGIVNGNEDDSETAVAAAPAATAPAAVTPQAPAASAAPATEAAVPAPYNGYGKTEAKYGEQVEAGGLSVTAAAPKTISQEYLGDQVCSTVTYRNTSDKSERFSMFDWKFRTANGVETNSSIPFNAGDSALNTGELAPGGTTTGKVCGDSQTKNVTAIVYNPGFGIMHEVTFSK